MPKAPKAIHWLEDAEPHMYEAAASYLSLIYADSSVGGVSDGCFRVNDLVGALKATKLARFKAKDIFRASGLSLLGVSNLHVEKVRSKIRKNKPLSPILLVRDPAHGKVVIADGYHRLSAVYGFDEDALIPCKIV